MPPRGWKYTIKRKWHTISFEDAMEVALSEGEWNGWDAILLKRMQPTVRTDPYTMSPSSLTDCLRCRILETRIDYFVDPRDQMALTRGNAWHKYLEEEDGNSEFWLKFVREYEGPEGQMIEVPFRARGDRRTPGPQILHDYKSTRTVREKVDGKWQNKQLPSATHELQINMYALGSRLNDWPVERLLFHYITNDDTVLTVEADLWTLEEQLEVIDFFGAKVAEAKAMAPELPPYEPLDEDDEGDARCHWFPKEIKAMCQKLR